MHNYTLALGAIIAITAMMAIPTTNFHVAKAYSCSSSSSAAKAPSSSTSVNGNQGSCATSSSSSSKASIGVAGTTAGTPNRQLDSNGLGQGVTTSSSSGGAQSSCSNSFTNQQFAASFSQSQQGHCP
jgi:hypothetical protein